MLVARGSEPAPSAASLSYLTGRFVEADAEREATADDGRKIDYIFGTRRHFAVAQADVEKYAESDHALMTGRFTLERGNRGRAATG